MPLFCLDIPLTKAERDILETEAVRRCKEVTDKEITCIHLCGYDEEFKGFLFEMDLDHGTHYFSTVVGVSDSNPILKRTARNELIVEGDVVAEFLTEVLR